MSQSASANFKKKNLKERVQVFIRCRPLLKSELNLPVPVEIHPEVNKVLIRDSGADKCCVKSFSFDKVFGPEAKQADIYAGVVAPIIQEVIMGFNCTIFAYGQTGTGKTFTIEGDKTPNLKDMSEDPLSGIIPRSMKHLLNELSEQNVQFEICVSFLELYNEEIFDLLSPYDFPVKLKLFDNSAKKGSVIVQGLQVRSVSSLAEVYDILDKGFKKRRKAATLLNKASSRSHTVFTVTVNINECSLNYKKVKKGKLNLVDLAGSENIGRSGAIHKTAREAGNINQSLLTLGRVITSLCENAGHIPYRESKLTRLLQDSLGGQTKTAIIATISPSSDHIDETLNTLEYALRAKNITNKPEVDSEVSATSLYKDYLAEINNLRKEINKYAAENNLYVPEELLKDWESTLATKRDEKFELLSQISVLMEEEASLDNEIKEANDRLAERKNYLAATKLKCEKYKQELEKEKEDFALNEKMLKITQPLYDDLHEKLHKSMEEHRNLTSEVTTMKEKLKSSSEEYRNLKEKYQNVKESRKQKNEIIHNKAEILLNDVKNMNDSVTSVTSECINTVSTLQNNFESAATIWDSGIEKVFKAASGLRAIDQSFKENIQRVIDEERSAMVKDFQEAYEAYLASNESSILEPLNTMNDCKISLREISSAISGWEKGIVSEMHTLQQLLKERLNNHNNVFKSMKDSVSALLTEQKRDTAACQAIFSEIEESEATIKKSWNEQFESLEEALSSLDNFCTVHVEKEVGKASKASKLFTNSSRIQNQILEKLTAFCESSSQITEASLKETESNKVEAFCDRWKEMEKKVEKSRQKYKELNFELAKFSRQPQDYERLPSHIEDVLKPKFRLLENPEISFYTQEMCNSIQKWGDSLKAQIMESQSEVEARLSKGKTCTMDLTKSHNYLSGPINDDVPDYIQTFENCFKNMLSTEDTSESTSNGIDATVNDTDTNTTIVTSSCVDETINCDTEEKECPVCAHNIPDRTLRADENNPPAIEIVDALENVSNNLATTSTERSEISRSKSFRVASSQQSPVRRPRAKNFKPARKNLKYFDVEKLANQLLQSSSDEEL